MRRM